MKRYSEYKDSGVKWIGEIPSHWEVKRLKSLFLSHKAGAWGEEEKKDGNDRVCLRIADFDYKNLRFKKHIPYTLRSYKSEVVSSLKLHKGEILIEKSGGGEKTPVGRCVLYDLDIDEALYANFMDKLVVRKECLPTFVVYLLSVMYDKGAIWKYIKQTTGLQNLDLNDFLTFELVSVPSQLEQQAIVDYLKVKTDKIEQYVAQRERAA